MKKDGFVSMTLVYTFLVLFLFLMLAVLNAYARQNRYLQTIDSKIDLTIHTPSKDNYCPYSLGQSFDYDYVGREQTFMTGCEGTYKIEVWGAQGGSKGSSAVGGKGAYASGEIKLEKYIPLYIYVGNMPTFTSGDCFSTNDNASFNGNTSGSCSGGGGASDVRLIKAQWSNPSSLRSRIIVAAGGGGAIYDGNGGSGGALTGNTASGGSAPGSGGKQTSSSFGIGTTSTTSGGGGYYGGEGGYSSNAGGGSSYISGYLGSIAVASELTTLARNDSNDVRCTEDSENQDSVCSHHYSNYIFYNTTMISGNESMPRWNGSGMMNGNTGNGHVRITFISD